MIMFYVQGDIVQSDCSRKEGPLEVVTLPADDPKLTVSEIVKEYESRNGYCSSIKIEIVK
jgi:hypothetical protein